MAGAYSTSREEESKTSASPRKPTNANPKLKQRGIYSEFLHRTKIGPPATNNGDDAHSNGGATYASTHAAGSASASSSSGAQKPPKASSFKRMGPSPSHTPSPLLAQAGSIGGLTAHAFGGALAASSSGSTSPTPPAGVSSSASASSLPSIASLSRLEPKVLVPYEQRPGKPPRRIEIERKKRLYAAQDLEALLQRAGVNYNQYRVDQDHASGNVSYLALEIFDNTDFESRQAKEWIELGRNEINITRGLAAATTFTSLVSVTVTLYFAAVLEMAEAS
jgi:hypothetical protein